MLPLLVLADLPRRAALDRWHAVPHSGALAWTHPGPRYHGRCSQTSSRGHCSSSCACCPRLHRGTSANFCPPRPTFLSTKGSPLVAHSCARCQAAPPAFSVPPERDHRAEGLFQNCLLASLVLIWACALLGLVSHTACCALTVLWYECVALLKSVEQLVVQILLA